MLRFFIRGSKHLETIKALRLWSRAFIRFSVFGTPDENLALVFDLLLHFFSSVLVRNSAISLRIAMFNHEKTAWRAAPGNEVDQCSLAQSEASFPGR